MTRAAFILILSFLIIYCSGAKAAGNLIAHKPISGYRLPAPSNDVASPKILQPTTIVTNVPSGYDKNQFAAATSMKIRNISITAIFWLFIQSLLLGLLAVFTPYVYTIHPFTTGYLARNVRSAKERMFKSLIYALSLILIFTTFGLLISIITKLTGVQKYAGHWIFNFYLCRTYIVLGISFLGGFSMKLPESWINSLAKRAVSNDVRGIIIMALTLPGASFASTFPIIALVLLLAFNVSLLGPVIGLFGFAIGLALPFVFPAILKVFIKSKSLLNTIKVTMGFLSLMIALKFASNADVSLGLNLLDRNMFIVIWMIVWAFMGIYMLGLVKLTNDTEPERNIYGQEYISLSSLFIAIMSFVMVLYLLPGIWGAPLHGVSGFLPQ